MGSDAPAPEERPAVATLQPVAPAVAEAENAAPEPSGFEAAAAESPQAKAEAVVRPDVTDVNTGHIDYLQQSLVPLESETHGGDDVAVFAWGPSAHAFHGVVEQNLIYHVMAHALGLPGDAGPQARTD